MPFQAAAIGPETALSPQNIGEQSRDARRVRDPPVETCDFAFGNKCRVHCTTQGCAGPEEVQEVMG